MSDTGLRGGTVLVSGAGRGLGREVALRLAARGFTVIAAMRRPEPLHDLEVLSLNVADGTSVRAAAECVRARHGRLDALVNNAGILLDGATGLMDLEAEVLRRTLETNTLGPLRMAQAFAPLMPPGV